MDKQTFLRRLEEGLRQLPPEEREDILQAVEKVACATFSRFS